MLTDALLVAALLSLVSSALVGLVSAAWLQVRSGEMATEPPLTVGIGQRPGVESVPHIAVWLGLGFLIAALSVRTFAAGRVPWVNMYEFNQAFAAAILGAYLVMERRQPIRRLAPLAAVAAAGLVAYTLTLPSQITPLPPALQTPFFLTVHVGSAMLAYGLYAFAAAAALGQIAQARSEDRFIWLPPAAVCRATAHRAVLLGLPILTLAILLGSVWAHLAWRSYWNNDPKELAAVATWFVYAAYLHLAARRDRWGAAAPWLLILGAGGVAFTYFAANLVIPGQHSYSGL